MTYKSKNLKKSLVFFGAFVVLAILAGTNRIPEMVLKSSTKCNRAQAYEIDPSLRRAISLIDQRTSEAIIKATPSIFPDGIRQISKSEYDQLDGSTQLIYNNYAYFNAVQNCLDIRYSSGLRLNDAEGLFVPRDSSPNHLIILISENYRDKDDLLTAILLSHEISHAIWYNENREKNSEEDCFQNETNAYFNQFVFLNTLNEEELNSIRARIAIQSTKELLFLKKLQDSIIWTENPFETIKSILRNDNYYKEQCSVED